MRAMLPGRRGRASARRPPSPRRNRRRGRRERAAFALYCAALVAGPLLFGAVHAYAYALVFSMVLAATLLLLLEQVERDPDTGARSFLCLHTGMNFLFAAVLGYLFLLILPLPRALAGWLSPESVAMALASVPPARAAASPDGGLGGWVRLAPYAYPVLMSIVRWTVYGFLFLGLSRTMSTRRRIETVAACILGAALFESVYGIMEAYSSPQRIWWHAMTVGRHQVTGTYINRNHFAGFMGLGLALACTYAAALSGPRAGRRRDRRDGEGSASPRVRLSRWLSGERRISKRSLAVFSGAVIGLGLLGSGSRGGLAAACVGFAAMAGMFLARGGQSRHRKGGLLIALVLLAALGYALYRGMDYTFERFRVEGASPEQRAVYIRNSLALFADYPAFGVGPGNFPFAYARYRSPEEEGEFLTDAHSDWAQALAETGAAGVALFVAGFGVFLAGAWRRWRGRRDPFAVWLGVLPFAAAAAVAAHSLFEFSLRVPANAMVFTALLAVGARAGQAEVRPDGERSGLRFCRRPLRGAGGALLLALLALCAWCEVRVVRHFLAEANCSTVINSTLHRDPNPPVEEIRRAAAWDGANAAYPYRLAVNLRFLRDTPEGRERLAASVGDPAALSAEIVSALERSAGLDPFSAEVHHLLGWEYSFLWDRPDYAQTWQPAADLAMTRAAALAGPTHGWLHKEMGNYWLVRSRSPSLDPAFREQALERAGQHYRTAIALGPGGPDSAMEREIRQTVRNLLPDEALERRLLQGP